MILIRSINYINRKDMQDGFTPGLPRLGAALAYILKSVRSVRSVSLSTKIADAYLTLYSNRQEGSDE